MISAFLFRGRVTGSQEKLIPDVNSTAFAVKKYIAGVDGEKKKKREKNVSSSFPYWKGIHKTVFNFYLFW